MNVIFNDGLLVYHVGAGWAKSSRNPPTQSEVVAARRDCTWGCRAPLRTPSWCFPLLPGVTTPHSNSQPDPPEASVPGRRVVRPAPADHRRDDVHASQLFGLERERVAVDDHEVGEIAREEAAATPLVS